MIEDSKTDIMNETPAIATRGYLRKNRGSFEKKSPNGRRTQKSAPKMNGSMAPVTEKKNNYRYNNENLSGKVRKKGEKESLKKIYE